MVDALPKKAAPMSGVEPFALLAFTSAPASRSAATIVGMPRSSVSPRAAAQCSAVLPSSRSFLFGYARAASSRRT
eukprot:4048967-Prymnesium_polylepis.2